VTYDPTKAGNCASGALRSFGARALVCFALSLLCGALIGYALGAHTGVRPGVEAGARVDAASLAQALPWKAEIANEPAARQQMARLLEEVRINRAQMEALRHAAETQRAGERLKALETAREALTEGLRAEERAAGRLATELTHVHERLDRLEKGAIDMAPTASIVAPAQKRAERKPKN
jgi:hypothetical protein